MEQIMCIKAAKLQSHSSWFFSLALGVVAIVFIGCSSVGEIKGQQTGTGVAQAMDNYKVLKAGAVGESKGYRILALIPVSSPSYAEAKENLYASVGQRLEGRPIALANLTEDRANQWFVLFSVRKVTLSGDVIEYLDDPKP
jgi:hypothetical protein